jgi:hypothetical protein
MDPNGHPLPICRNFPIPIGRIHHPPGGIGRALPANPEVCSNVAWRTPVHQNRPRHRLTALGQPRFADLFIE